MEKEEWVRRSVEVAVACSSAPFDVGMYAMFLRQNYLPPSTFGYIRKHWVSQSCLDVAAQFFEDAAEEVGVGLGDLGKAWVAGGGFVLASLRIKHALEYEVVFLPGDVKEFLRSAAVESFDLDTVAGAVWPTLLSYGAPALRMLEWLGIDVDLRTAARLAAPFAVFGAVSDALSILGSPPGHINPTGYGAFLCKLMEDVVLFSRWFEPRAADVVVPLAAALRARELLLREPATPSEWRRLAKQASRRYEELGGMPGLYTPFDAESDLIHFLLAAVDHYERGSESARDLLRSTVWGAYISEPQKLKESVLRLFAVLVR